ncbi:MAG: hypothetical protein IJX28_00550 [Clostridia bacterium]|nr:hypothetical protein [Clostridia bacterium]
MPSAQKRGWIRLAYLFPILVGTLLLIYACLPHIYFIYNGEVHETVSSWELFGNTWSECRALLKAENATQEAVFFSYVLLTFAVLSMLLLLVHAAVAVASAVFSCRAFSYPPTDRMANRSKRWLQFFCPGRICYVVVGLFPLVPACLPHLLSYLYKAYFGLDVRACFFFLPDVAMAGILTLMSTLAFLLTLGIQAEEHMDMFRLYKKK